MNISCLCRNCTSPVTADSFRSQCARSHICTANCHTQTISHSAHHINFTECWVFYTHIVHIYVLKKIFFLSFFVLHGPPTLFRCSVLAVFLKASIPDILNGNCSHHSYSMARNWLTMCGRAFSRQSSSGLSV